MRRLFVALLLLFPCLLLPRALLGVESSRWSESEAPLALSEHLHELALAPPAGLGPTPMGIDPGAEQFVGEWIFGTWMMAAAGHAQLGLAWPEHRAQQAERAALAIDLAIREESWAFDTARWGDSAFSHLDGEGDHDHAVLGYLGVSLGLLRLLEPDNRHAALHDRISAFLAARLQATPALATFPGEAYPVDHAASLATVALHARARGEAPPAWLDASLADFQSRYLDPRGLLIKSVHPGSGEHRSIARGSGSALGAWFLGFADPELSARLARSIRAELATTGAGVGVVLEYAPAAYEAGHPCQGDVDSGPLILGASVSATGFSLASARRLGDEDWQRRLWGTARTFGAYDGRSFHTGGPLGNAIMLAMLTGGWSEGAEG